MPMSKGISFSKAIRHTAVMVAPHLRMNPGAKRLIAQILTSFNDDFVSRCRSGVKPSNKNGLHVTIDVFHGVLTEMIPEDLRHHALACASRNVLRYEHQLLGFKPKTVRTSKLHPKKAFPEFTQGLPRIADSVYPGVKLEPNVKAAMARALKEITNLIASKAQQSAGEGGTLTHHHVAEGLTEILGNAIARHAIAEGMRSLMLYEMGCISFDDKDFRVPRRPKSPKKNTNANKKK